MNEELQKKLIEWVENIGKLTMEEIPPFMQEIATYGWISGMIWIGLSIFFMIGAAIGWNYFYSSMIRDHDDGVMAGFILGLICSVIGVIIFCVHIEETIKARFAPKLYVLEKFLNK